MTVEWFDDPDFVTLANTLLEAADDSWDGDFGIEDILIGYVRHLVDEVRRLGGCLRNYCLWNDGDPCDHGYCPTPEPVTVRTNRLIAELLEIEDQLQP